jgi:uncharacterized membrane protein (DUF2068 family)
VIAFVDDEVATDLTGTGPDGVLLRCLRCGDFTEADGAHQTLIGAAQSPAPLAQLPLVLRGAHGRKLALLRILAVERGARGLLLLAAALGIARLANSHVAIAGVLGRAALAAQPLASMIGWDLLRSQLLKEAQSLLGHSNQTYTTVAFLLGGYGLVQIVEGTGLWGGWRWAEYLAVVATSAFVPLEVYEVAMHLTVFKLGALAINLVAVVYLVHKGRLFGWKGGHSAYLAEVRDGTLLATLLRHRGRNTTALSGHELA